MGHCIAVNYYYYWIYSIDTWCGMTHFRIVFSCSEFNDAKQPHQHHIMASLNLHCNRFANALRQMSEQSRREKLTNHSNEREEEKLIHWNTNSLKKNYKSRHLRTGVEGGTLLSSAPSIHRCLERVTNADRPILVLIALIADQVALSTNKGIFPEVADCPLHKFFHES